MDKNKYAFLTDGLCNCITLSVFIWLVLGVLVGIVKSEKGNTTTTPQVKKNVDVAARVTLTASNTVIYDTDISLVSVNNIYSSIVNKRSITPIYEPIYLVIVSGGGQYSAVRLLVDNLRQIPNLVMICRYCASSAGYLFATHSGRRLVSKGSELLMHEMFIPKLTANDTKNPQVITSLVQSSNEFNQTIAKIIGISIEQYEAKIIPNKEWSLLDADIVKHKLADAVISKIECDVWIRQMAPMTCVSGMMTSK